MQKPTDKTTLKFIGAQMLLMFRFTIMQINEWIKLNYKFISQKLDYSQWIQCIIRVSELENVEM